MSCACVRVCVCMRVCVHQVHRSGDGSGEETVEVTGNETARLKAQELIEEVINSPATRGTARARAEEVY